MRRRFLSGFAAADHRERAFLAVDLEPVFAAVIRMHADVGVDDRTVFEPTRNMMLSGEVTSTYRFVSVSNHCGTCVLTSAETSANSPATMHRRRSLAERDRQRVRAERHVALPGTVGGAREDAAAHWLMFTESTWPT